MSKKKRDGHDEKHVVIGGADGPTAVFITKGGGKLNFRQRENTTYHSEKAGGKEDYRRDAQYV